MNQLFQKPIATILIIGLILSLAFNLFLFKPKQAKALDGGGAWAEAIKDLVLDAVGWVVTDVVLKRLESKIIAWGTGQRSDANEPFGVIDWKLFFADAINRGSAIFISEFDEAFDFVEGACEQGLKIKNALGNLGFGTYYNDLPKYSQYARPTLEDLGLEACQEFVESGYSLLAGGWSGWFNLTMQPQNNIFGQVLMAEAARRTAEEEEKEAANKETDVSKGYQNEKVTKASDTDKCKTHCNNTYGVEVGPPSPALRDCLARCDRKLGIPLETKVKNLGTTIEKQMTDALGKDMARVISADEITELIGVLFSALVNRAIDGMGLAFISQKGTASEKSRASQKQTYSYQSSFKKEQTVGDIKDIRSSLLTSILKAIQQLSFSITSCDEDEMMTFEDYSKNVADILSANTEALYVGMEGVNLKPDFEVLDHRFTPPTHFFAPPPADHVINGYSWGEVPATKIPDKCRNIIKEYYKQSYVNMSEATAEATAEIAASRSTCQNIKSGLEPPTPTKALLEDIAKSKKPPEHTTWTTDPSGDCTQCIYDHDPLNCSPAPFPPQSYPILSKEIWPGNITKQKDEFYWGCRSQYNHILDRCHDCLKKADEQCAKSNDEEKEDCIVERNLCNDYLYVQSEVISPPVDNIDFYKKCLIEEQKEACYVCLKEYFMPATYCEQIAGYIARSIVKYPVIVHYKGGNANFHLGRKDEIKAAQGNACSDNSQPQNVDVALLCSIMPDFSYAGQKICETWCNKYGMTAEELRDVTDWRPHALDCGGTTLPIGGHEPWSAISDGVLRMRGKCCAALNVHDATKFKTCGGSSEQPACTYAKPHWQEPWCYCDEGERPLGWTKIKPWPEYKYPDDKMTMSYCGDFHFNSPGKEVRIYTDATPGGGTVYIATGNCTDPDKNKIREDADNNGEPDDDHMANGPGGTICSFETPRCAPGACGQEYFCDLSGKTGEVHGGVYNPTNEIKYSTAMHVCAKCDPSDPNYDYGLYGTDYDQCTGKVK